MEIGSDASAKARLGVHYLRVRYAETDQMGVAHHGSYIPWIEEARTEWLREYGTSYRQMEESGLAFAVTHVDIRYLKSARYDDRIRIETWLVEKRMASVTLGYRLFLSDEDGTKGPLLSEASTRLALIGDKGRPVRFPDGIL